MSFQIITVGLHPADDLLFLIAYPVDIKPAPDIKRQPSGTSPPSQVPVINYLIHMTDG